MNKSKTTRMPAFSLRLQEGLHERISKCAAEQHIPTSTYMRQQLAKIVEGSRHA